MSGNVWEAAPTAVEEGFVVCKGRRADFVLEVVGDGRLLVVWLAEVVGEAA